MDLALKSDDIQPLLWKELLALWMVLQIFFHKEFLFCLELLDILRKQ